MVVRVLVVELDHVVVHVLHDQRNLDPVHVELLELHPRHRAGGVLKQDLVDAIADRFAPLERSLDEVLRQDLLEDVLRQLTLRLQA
jgi:hypothetical protein